MNARILFIVIITTVTAGGAMLYKNFSAKHHPQKEICVFVPHTQVAKNDLSLLTQELKLLGIEKDQITQNQDVNSIVKIFFDQHEFEEWAKKDDLSLKIAVRLHKTLLEDGPKVIGIFEEDKAELLLELVETTIKSPIRCLLICDENTEQSKKLAQRYQELAKIKGISMVTLILKANDNVASHLKGIENTANSIVIIPGKIILKEIELILEHFKHHKIPVFANHIGIIRQGALGGYDFDAQEIAHSIAQVVAGYIKDPKNIRSNPFDDLCAQLHLNMDTISRLGTQLDAELIDEAVTVGGVDL